LTQAAFALGRLFGQDMTGVRLGEFHFTGTSFFKSFGRGAVGFDFGHDNNLLGAKSRWRGQIKGVRPRHFYIIKSECNLMSVYANDQKNSFLSRFGGKYHNHGAPFKFGHLLDDRILSSFFGNLFQHIATTRG